MGCIAEKHTSPPESPPMRRDSDLFDQLIMSVIVVILAALLWGLSALVG